MTHSPQDLPSETENPAEVLREASARIRKDQDIEEQLGHIDSRELDTWLAVAHWLDSEAVVIYVQLERQADPGRRFGGLWMTAAADRHRHALKVARTYLGRP